MSVEMQMRYAIVDLEATCWLNNKDNTRMETIEIGALLLPDSLTLPAPEYQRFIRPQVNPQLSDFCTQLTTITQADVDAAATFDVVFPEFVAWVGVDQDEPVTFCSWGSYDYKQLKLDCARWGTAFPTAFETPLNLKKLFKQFHKERPGMKDALAILGLTLEGTHHRGIDDARNIARIAQDLLTRLRDRQAERALPPAPGGAA